MRVFLLQNQGYVMMRVPNVAELPREENVQTVPYFTNMQTTARSHVVYVVSLDYIAFFIANFHISAIALHDQNASIILLTEFVPTTQTECIFPKAYGGNWLLFEDNWKERVNIASGFITFSSLGEFICKSKHWEELNYKLLSHYTNGWYVRKKKPKLAENDNVTDFWKMQLTTQTRCRNSNAMS